MIEKIEILQHCEGSHLGFHSGKETAWLLCIVAYHHEVVIQLRTDGLDSISEAFTSLWQRRGGEMITFSTPLLLLKPLERPSSHATRGGQCGEYRAKHRYHNLNHCLPTFFLHNIPPFLTLNSELYWVV